LYTPSHHNIEKHLRSLITHCGPLNLDQFLAILSANYYAQSENLTKDFITAPELSRMFNYAITKWIIEQWGIAAAKHGGNIPSTTLVELGPGMGTMLADILSMIPHNLRRNICEIILIESSPTLRKQQLKTLQTSLPITHYHSISELIKKDSIPNAQKTSMVIVLANEFFDALPIKQFARTQSGILAEVMVCLNEKDGGFQFKTSPHNTIHQPSSHLDAGDILETSPLCHITANSIAGLFTQYTCARALIIDYGYTTSPKTSTLRTIRNHTTLSSIFMHIGEADISAEVDFSALLKIFPEHETQLCTLQDFLLKQFSFFHKNTSLQDDVFITYQRIPVSTSFQLKFLLKDMGTLFKVLEIRGY